MDKQDTDKVQPKYLNQLRKAETVVAVFLQNGNKLTGTIISFDQYTVLLKARIGGASEVIQKSAIATIGPNQRPIRKK